MIVQAADAADVARVVMLARDAGLELAVRSGGHSPAGQIVLDLSTMRGLDLDRETLTAAQPGLTAPADKPVREAWVNQFAAALQQRDDGAYVGLLTDAGPARIRQAYPGSTWDRLVQLKTRYDPTNLFHHNHNISTAIEGREP